MSGTVLCEAKCVIAEQGRFRAFYTAFTLSTREVCHVVPSTDRLSVCAALSGAGEH